MVTRGQVAEMVEVGDVEQGLRMLTGFYTEVSDHCLVHQKLMLHCM